VAKILLIDDDDKLTGFLARELGNRGHEVVDLDSAEEAPRLLLEARPSFRLVLLDIGLSGGMSGLDLLKALRARGVEVQVVVVSGNEDSETAIEATRLGARDYVIKQHDFQSLYRKLDPVVREALKDTEPLPAVSLPRETSLPSGAGPSLVGRNDAMRRVYRLIGEYAPGDDPVLILGETGTGKELVARALHTHSDRKGKPFVALNCAAFPENLLETELFGHEKGAFSGADKLRKGKFEHADGGTVFLDEIGDMPLRLQPKLLRVIQERCIERVGGNEPIPVNVRFLSATHCDLETAVREGTFRKDLYFRLNAMEIRLPPLRQRLDDLPLLAAYFVRRAAEERGRTPPAVADSTLDRLRAHPWPGNVRELENALRRAVGVCRGPQILCEHLPALNVVGGAADLAADLERVILRAFETHEENLYPLLNDLLQKELLRVALERLGGNQSRAAELLGMGRTTVSKLTQLYGLR
jgi:two-component system NtrC family response regulator/two-component system nitrogen regulation response regulator GlnG